MRNLVFLSLVSFSLLTLVLSSSYVVSDPDLVCCCERCDCTGDDCDVGSCESYEWECPSDLERCSDTFCTYCIDSSDCLAVDSDGGKNIYEMGVCHWFRCDSNNRCVETTSTRDSGSYYSDVVYEKFPSENPTEPNKCDSENIPCPSGYEYTDRACIEIGAKEGEFCDDMTEQTTCMSGLQCCDECSKCYETCPNDLCCDSDDDCSQDLPYCNLIETKCQAECPRSEYDTCEEAEDGGLVEIGCGKTTGCLYKNDDKFYNLTGLSNKEVTITLSHSGNDNCNRNDLVIYDKNCNEIDKSENSDRADELDPFEPESDDVIVMVRGDCTRDECEGCNWGLDVDCEDVCSESKSSLTAKYTADCDQLDCMLKIGLRDHITGCLYAGDSKFFSLQFMEGENHEIKLTNKGSDCESNSLYIYDYHYADTGEPYAIEGEDSVKSWVGIPRNPNPGQYFPPGTWPRLNIEIRSNSENKNCLWELDTTVVGECETLCSDNEGKDCSPFKCVVSSCSDICDERCGADCETDDDCVDEHGEGWFCNSDCVCAQGIKREIDLTEEWSLISQPFEEFTSDTDCDIKKIYAWDPEADIPFRRLESLDDTEGGYGYWILKDGDDCKITFIGSQIATEVELDTEWGLIGPINNEEMTVNQLKADCNDLEKVYKYAGPDATLPFERLTENDRLYPGIGYWVKLKEVGSIPSNMISPCTIQ